MNRLQEEIRKAAGIDSWEAKKAAEVAMRWIEKAFDAGGDRSTFHGRPGMKDAPTKEEGLKENGLTPTEPGPVIGSNGKTDPPNETKF